MGFMLIGLLGYPAASADGPYNNSIYFENEFIAFRITGNENVPQYQFWRPDESVSQNETVAYNMKFIKIFEFIDENDDDTYQIGEVIPFTDPLAKLSWEFSEITTTEDDVVHFTMTSVGRNYTIQFINHFNPDDVSLKFDIKLEDYTFTSTHENISFGIGFHLVSVNKDMYQIQNEIRFGQDAFFEAAPEAICPTTGHKLSVGLSHGEEDSNNMAFLSFPKFEGDLEYDPIIGFSSKTPSASPENGNNKNVYFENENIAIRITGNENVPQYQFWRPSENLTINETTTYQVKFIKLFEFIDENGDNTYNPENESSVPQSTDALAALAWDFTNITTDTDGMVHFNMTSSGRDYTIQFNNHFDPADASIKFDIILEDYEFISNHENASLVLGFHLVSTEKEMNQIQSQHEIQFGEDGFFDVAPHANTTAANVSMPVGLSNAEEGENMMAFITFPNFEGNVTLDPTIGFLTEDFDDPDDDTDDNDSPADDDDGNIPGYSVLVLGMISVVSLLGIIRRHHK